MRKINNQSLPITHTHFPHHINSINFWKHKNSISKFFLNYKQNHIKTFLTMHKKQLQVN